MAATAAMSLQVSQLYVALFGRAPDAEGLGYWVNRMAGGESEQSIANAMFGVSAARTYYPSFFTNEQIVASFYTNVLGRVNPLTTDPTGVAFWTAKLNGGTSVGDLVVQMVTAITTWSGTDAAGIASKALFNNKVAVAQYYATTLQGDLTGVTQVLGNVTATSDTSTPAAIANLIAASGASAFTLTTGTDIKTATSFLADLAPHDFSGNGPTLNVGDVLTGQGTNATLKIVDGYAQGNDVLARGVSLNNIANIIVDTQGNAGGNASFDTTGVAGLKTLTVVSQGGNDDHLIASTTTDIAVTHNNASGATLVDGGHNVTVVSNSSDDVLIGDWNTSPTLNETGNFLPTGDVSVTINGEAGNVKVLGGVNVTVNATSVEHGDGGEWIRVGSYGNFDNGIVDSYLPAGNVTINDKGTANIYVEQSATTQKINITSAGGSIYVGDDGYAYTSDGQDYTLAPLVNNADVTIVDTAVHASKAESIDVYGGHNINITTNVANIQVGSDYYRWNSDNNSPNYSEKFSANPTGTVNITSTATDYSGIYVHGGTDVTVTAANAEVQVGVAEDQTWASNPTGNVSVTETKAVTYDGGLNSAFDSNSNGWVQIGGGVNATVNAKGQNVAIGVERTVGDVMTTPSGAITVNQSAVLTGTNGIANGQGYIDINGGTNVTVNTTGGGVDIGWAWYGNNSTGYYTAPTGNVSITDTFSGPNTDWLFTLGGAAVNITTTATSGYIVVGGTNGSPDASLALNDAGTALKNPTYAATGNVAIVNQTTSGVFHLNNSGWSENDPTNTKYGTSDVTVYTNGSQTVSVAGADNAYITDVNTVWATAGDKAGLAVGTSKLATVNLTGVMNSATITSDVFANLNVKDSYVNIDIDNNATAAANLAVSVANSDIWVTNHSNATAVTVTSLAGDTSWFGMDDNSTITTLTFNNAGTLNVWNGDGNEGYNDNLGALTTIVAKGSGTLNLGIVSYDGDDTTLNKVDASQASGAVNVAFNPDDVEFIGGQGNDTVTLLSYFDFGNDSINNQTVIDGGLGANTLEINYEGNGESFKAADGFTHFQTLRFGQVATDVNPNENGDTGENYAYGTFNTTGYSNIEVGYIYDTLYLNHLSNAGTVTILGATGRNGATNLWTYNVNLGLNTTSTAATFTVNLGTVGGAENVGKSSDYQVVNAGVWDGGGTLKTFNLVSQGKASGTNYVELNTSNVTTLNISGATNLTLSTDDSARYSTIDAHLSSGNVNVVDVQTADGNVTLLGGSGLLTADISGGDATAVDTVTSGSGGVHVELGLGGAWDNANANGSQNGISYYGASSAGSETVNLSASVAAVDTLGVGAGVNAVKSGSVGGVTGFQTIASTKADVLEIGGYQLANTSGAASSHVVGDLDTAYLAIGFDPSGSMLSKLSNLYYTASNGVITFSAATGHNDLLSDTTLLQRAAELIVQSAANDNSERTTAIFNVGGNSYVVSANAGSISESIVRPTLTVYGSAWSNNAYIACHVNGVEIGFNIGTWDPSAHDIAVTLANLINDHFQYYSPTASGPIATVNGSGSTITLALATSLVPGGYLFTGGTAEPDAVEFSINNVRSVTTYDNTSVVELLGNTTVGFGDTAAGNTILSDVIQQVADSSTSGVYDSVNSTSANEIYKAGGFSEIYLHDGDFGSKTTTVNSLAASGVLDVGYTNVESAVAVNQLGASGQNSLTVNFGNYADLKSLTLNGDWTAILNNDNSSSVYIHELVDATNTISTLALHDHASGSNSYTEINKITSTSLTTIDATDLANFQLGNGTDWSNSSLNNATVTGLTQSNLTVKLGDVYSADIVATGNHVTFTQTTGASVYDNDLYIQANGAANTFNVNGGYIMANGAGDTFNIGASNQTVYVEAAGAGDTFNIKGNAHVAGLNYLHTGDFMTATGANDTFTITGSGDVYMWAGSNAVINLGTASSAFGGYLDLTIKGDVTGTTSAGSYAYTTLNLGNLQGNYSIELNSNLYSLNNVNDGYYYTSGGAVDTNFGDSLVNVATATSLAQALDIAAAQGASAHGGTLLAHTSVLDWFQFGGNTYIVEANNITAVDAAHTGLGANDVVIKITGLVDLSGLDIYSGALNTIQY